ncbi:MAG: alkaline phosphatase family protein [Proteobacteria bacterium]|nr:alkaline phosphatase family protein [Pseudomonadota bacterium]
MAAFEHDLTPVKPDYDGGSIVNLMRSIGDKFGATPSDYPPLAALPPERLGAARRVVLIVIDGLGAELLRNVGRGSRLGELASNTMTSVYPPTTASAITTFMTGLAPQQHGLTGWFMHFRRLGAVTAVLPFVPRYGRKPLSRAGVDLASLLDCPSFFSRIKAPSMTLQPAAIADSDFSRHLAQGAERIPYTTLAEFADRLQAYCHGESGAAYLYAYWSNLDRLAHIHGPSSDAVKVHFDEIDAALSAVIEVCDDSGTLLIITADHGFIDSGDDERIDLENHPALADTLALPLCGEPRTAYCYVRHHSAQAFEKYIDGELAQYATWLPSHQLIDDGWFGCGEPHAELAARIGDYTLLMRGRYTIRDRVAGELDIHLKGVHGGTSAAEQYVPLILAGP